VSKFGDDNGSDANDQPGNETSLNGFRLDSTQSSWLMDRLNALSEEDKIAMMAAHAEMQASEEQAGDNNNFIPPPKNDDLLGQQQYAGHGNHISHEMSSQYKDGELTDGGNLPPEDDHLPPSSGEMEDEENAYQMASEGDGDEPGGVDENALLLKEKIESLEQQLAEISTLSIGQAGDVDGNDDEKAGYDYEEGEPGLEGRGEEHYGSHEGLTQDQGAQNRASFEPQTHAPQVGDFPTQDNVVPERQHPHYSGHEGGGYQYGHGAGGQVPGGIASEGQGQAEHYQQGQHAQMGPDGQLHMVPDYGAPQNEAGRVVDTSHGQLHDQHAVQQYVPGQPYAEGTPYGLPPQEGNRGYEHAELPQFLAPVPPQHSGRPRNASIISGLLALAIAGGVAFTYFDEGVSDVIKGDFKAAPRMQTEKYWQKDLGEGAGVRNEKGVKGNDVAAIVGGSSRKFEVSKLVGLAGVDLPLVVKIPEIDGRSAFMVVRDLPKWASLNKGRFINGAWIVGITDLNGLTLKVPEDRPGEFSFVVEFVVNGVDQPMMRTVNAVIIANDKVVDTQPETVEKQAADKEAVEDQVVVAATRKTDDNSELIKPPAGRSSTQSLIIDEALEDKWLERGTRLLRSGDFSAARLAFSHLAEQGSGRGAMAMAMTFDPNQPSTRVVVGIKPDISRAKFWYNRALVLGNEAAREPLRMLNK